MKKLTGTFISLVGLVGGLVGLVWSFKLTTSTQIIVSLAVLVLATVFLIVLFVQSRRPEFTIVSLDKKLVLQDVEGRRATFERKSREVAGFDGLRELWFRNIAADGTIENITVASIPGSQETQTVKQLGLIHIRVLLNMPLKKGQEIETTLTYDILDSFVKPSEALIHVVNYRTRVLRIVIEFPAERPYRSAVLKEIFGGTTARIISLGMPEDNTRRRLGAEIENPKLGANYELRWEW
jgi:hypothetical protein